MPLPLIIIICFVTGQPEEDLADEEEGESERANLPDVQVDPTGIPHQTRYMYPTLTHIGIPH